MPLHPRVAEQWRALTGRPLVEGYGLTEASPVIACNNYEDPQVGTVGLPVPSTEISIRDGGVEVAPGDPGELCVRGPQVMRGYWNKEEETAKALTPDGWLRTGDLAAMGADGRIKIVDRIKDLIILSGFKVFPNEIETVVSEHFAVLECGCIGVPDARSGEAVKIFVVPRDGHVLTPEELHEHCRARLTAYKLPKHVEFRSSLPKTHIELMREEAARAA